MSVSKRDNQGIPFRGMELVTVTLRQHYTAAPDLPATQKGLCDKPEDKTELRMLPVGELRYINLQMPTMGMGKASASFSDQGTITGVSLDSDGTALGKDIAGLATAALPYLGLTQALSTLTAPVSDVTGLAGQVPGILDHASTVLSLDTNEKKSLMQAFIDSNLSVKERVAKYCRPSKVEIVDVALQPIRRPK